MMEYEIILHGMGFWNDDVGSRLENAATDTVHKFNEASKATWERIKVVASYKMEDIQYESQRGKLLGMKVEFRG